MTLFLFYILVFCSEVVYTLVPDADQVAMKPKVSHFDCDAMTVNTLYALNQVQKCHITPAELEISQRKIVFFPEHYGEKVNATKCQIQHQQEKRHCGQNEHSSIDHTITGVTSDLVTPPEQSRSLAK